MSSSHFDAFNFKKLSSAYLMMYSVFDDEGCDAHAHYTIAVQRAHIIP